MAEREPAYSQRTSRLLSARGYHYLIAEKIRQDLRNDTQQSIHRAHRQALGPPGKYDLERQVGHPLMEDSVALALDQFANRRTGIEAQVGAVEDTPFRVFETTEQHHQPHGQVHYIRNRYDDLPIRFEETLCLV